MSESEKYIPLSERLNQDVWHDNFVPKYSALASVRPSRLVLIGVWLIFAPMALGTLAMCVANFLDSEDLITAFILSIIPALAFSLAIAILITQTRRYLAATRRTRQDHPDATSSG